MSMYGLNYDLWQEMIENIASEYAPLFSLMHEMARELPLSRALVDELMSRNEPSISCEQQQMWLQIDHINDNIHGFRVYLMASLELNVLEETISETAKDYGILPEHIDAFEVEHGLDMLGDIFEKFRDTYGIQPEIRESCVLFMLVVFDSQDIDDSMGNDVFWDDSGYTN